MSHFRLNHQVWLAVHAGAVLTLMAVVAARPVAVWVLAAEGGIALVALAVLGRDDRFRAADWVTTIRIGGGIVALTAAARLLPIDGGALFFVLMATELSDFFDGMVARINGPTEFGTFWDAEVDAFFIAALSVSAVVLFGYPAWLLLPGAFRYGFFYLFKILPISTLDAPRSFRWYAKSACAVATVLLVGLFAPWLSRGFRMILGGVTVALLGVSFAWEATLRLGPLDELSGIVHSLVVYYALPFRKRRMKRMYRRFVEPGGLVFDIGSHVGNRLRPLTAIGARVVAVEPNPRCVAVLRHLYGRRRSVTIVEAAVGAEAGRTVLRVSPRHPTLATTSELWIEQVSANPLFRGIDWSREISVPVVTLDRLISAHGIPDFLKIDVEGMESEVLRGLSSSVGALSFEFLPAAIDGALECVSILESLDAYEFNYSMVETMRLALERWVSGAEISGILQAMPAKGRSGDVYARTFRD